MYTWGHQHTYLQTNDQNWTTKDFKFTLNFATRQPCLILSLPYTNNRLYDCSNRPVSVSKSISVRASTLLMFIARVPVVKAMHERQMISQWDSYHLWVLLITLITIVCRSIGSCGGYFSKINYSCFCGIIAYAEAWVSSLNMFPWRFFVYLRRGCYCCKSHGVCVCLGISGKDTLLFLMKLD